MKTLLKLIFFTISTCTVFGQFEKYVKSDTIFQRYSALVIDRDVYQRLQADDATLYIGCYFTTDTEGKVKSHKFIPFDSIGNEYNPHDSVWESVFTSITIASKNWIFKPVLWKFKDKKAEAQINKNPIQRPFKGHPRYFFIFDISGIGNTLVDKIGFIKNFNVSQ